MTIFENVICLNERKHMNHSLLFRRKNFMPHPFICCYINPDLSHWQQFIQRSWRIFEVPKIYRYIQFQPLCILSVFSLRTFVFAFIIVGSFVVDASSICKHSHKIINLDHVQVMFSENIIIKEHSCLFAFTFSFF